MGSTKVWVCLGLFMAMGCRGGDEAPAEGSEPASETSDTDTDSSDTATTIDTGTSEQPAADPDVQTWVPPAWPLDEPPVRVVFLGDSIAAGSGASSDDVDFVSLLLSNDDASYPAYAGWDVYSLFGEIQGYDASAPGATTETVLSSQLPWLEDTLGPVVDGPTLVVGTIGGNDVTDVVFGFQDLAVESERIATNLDAIAGFFLDEERFPDGSMVYLTNVYEPTDRVGQADQCFMGVDLSGLQDDFEALNARTLELAQGSGWAWVDLRGHFLGHGWNHDDEASPHYHPEDPTLWLARDCIHPNDRGHHEIRRLFLSAIDNRPLPAQAR